MWLAFLGLVLGACASPPPTLSPAERTVRIATTGCGWAGPNTASGVVAGAGLVVTAGHAVAAASSVELTLADGTVRPADVLSVDRRRDTAVLRPAGARLEGPPLPVAGADAGATGHLHGTATGVVPYSVTRYAEIVIDQIGDDPGHTRLGYELEATSAEGDSGGGAWDADGRLIGIVFATSTDGSPSTWLTAGSEVADHLAEDLGDPWTCDEARSRLVPPG